MDPLSRDENHTRWLTPKMWQEIKSSPEVVAEMLDDLKHGNKYYSGVETDKGVLLFGRDYMGKRQYDVFLAINIEKRFFEPGFEGKSLTVHELRGWPSLMEGKVNRCYDDYGCLLPLEEIPEDAFVDKPALKNVADTETFDLSPTWENYFRLTDNDTGLGLNRSTDNYDRMTLLYIMDKGYPGDGLTDESPDCFSFHKEFGRIESKLSGRDRWDVYDEMQEKAKKLAGRLLHEHFPDTRLKADAKERMDDNVATRKSKGMKM